MRQFSFGVFLIVVCVQFNSIVMASDAITRQMLSEGGFRPDPKQMGVFWRGDVTIRDAIKALHLRLTDLRREPIGDGEYMLSTMVGKDLVRFYFKDSEAGAKIPINELAICSVRVWTNYVK